MDADHDSKNAGAHSDASSKTAAEGSTPKKNGTAASSFVLGAAVLVGALAFAFLAETGDSPVVRGVAAPAFELPYLAEGPTERGRGATRAASSAAGDPSGVSSDRLALAGLEGKVVLVNFWATWCEPCTSEMPAMERLYQSLEGESFELVAVSIDDQVEEVADFQRRFSLSFPILLDLDQSIYRSYQTMGVPESLLIDREGRIVERYVGPKEWDAAVYEGRIRDLIAAEAGS